MTDESGNFTDLVKNIDFDTEPGGWDAESDTEFVKKSYEPAVRRNAPRNTRRNEDEASIERSLGVEESLEDSMEGIDFVADRYQSDTRLGTNVKKEKATISEVVPDFSMALENAPADHLVENVGLSCF